MRKFRALLSVNLKAMLLSASNSRGRGRRRMSGVGMLILIAFLGLYLSGTYSFAFALQLAPVGMLDLLLMMMPVLVTAMGVFYTVMAVQGVVFGGKDNDLMLSLPIPAFQLMLARVLVLVLENLVFSYVILLPAGVAYAVFGGAAGPGFWLRLLAGAAVLSLLPTTLALVLGFLLTWLSGKFGRGKALLRNLLYLVFFGAVLVLAFQSGTLIGTLAEHAAGIQAGFAGWGLPFLLFQRGVCGDGLAFLATTALCLLPFLLAVWLFGQRYQHLVTSLTARASRADYKLVRQSGSSQAPGAAEQGGAAVFQLDHVSVQYGLRSDSDAAAWRRGADQGPGADHASGAAGGRAASDAAAGAGHSVLPVHGSHLRLLHQPGGTLSLDSAGGPGGQPGRCWMSSGAFSSW